MQKLKFMWQRIQTIYMLLGAVVGIVVALYFPMYSISDQMVFPLDNPVLLFFFGFSTGALIANIFNFKKRSLQIVLNRIVLVANVILVAFMGYDVFGHASEDLHIGPSLFVPFITLLFIYLANRGIIKDEKLIRSSERIR